MVSQDDTGESQDHRDFFISYTGRDRQWAEWIAMQLEEVGYTLFIQAWDFQPGSNFVAEMDNATKRAKRTLLVLSPAYLESEYAFAEWAAAFRHDPRGTRQRLLPVRIEPCQVEGLLGPIVYIDLVALDEALARERLLTGVEPGRAKPATAAFPGQNILHAHTAFPGSLPTIWNIPYSRNPVFTGREHLLAQLADALKPGETVALAQPQAISGLGGIGKTQFAIEYAYRHRQDYQAVLWTSANTRESLVSGYVELAQLLALPQKDELDQVLIVKAVQEWLRTQTGWLLILDNADDLTLVREFLPPTFGGHILLTTRAQAVGRLAARIEVNTLDPDMGALLLLRRAGLITSDASLDVALPSDLALARAITEELDGLPLALDQAGAYIEETACELADYQRLYETRRAELLRSRGGFVDDHPEPVATTWSLSFKQVEQRNPAAADLLRLCAFLAPDAIPEELLEEALKVPRPVSGSKELKRGWRGWFSLVTFRDGKKQEEIPLKDTSWEIDNLVAVLRAYSLIQRNTQEKMVTVHRLVQVVLHDSMPAETQQHWMQQAVQAVNLVFPDVEFGNWPTCERLLPHALICATWIEQVPNATPEVAHLLHQTGYYLKERGRYAEAELLYQRALSIREQVLGANHPDTAQSLNNLAELYRAQRKDTEAEPLLQRALAISEKQLGISHPDTAISLNNLASLYRDQKKYAEAEPLLKRALAISEQQLDARHPDMVASLNNLAVLYKEQGKYAEAEPLFQRALAISEQQLGAGHPNTAGSLWWLAVLSEKQQHYQEAKVLYQRALAIYKQTLGPEHPTTQDIQADYTAFLEDTNQDEATE